MRKLDWRLIVGILFILLGLLIGCTSEDLCDCGVETYELNITKHTKTDPDGTITASIEYVRGDLIETSTAPCGFESGVYTDLSSLTQHVIKCN